MGTFTVSTHQLVRRALFVVAGLLGIAAAQAQNINVAGANSTNDRVYSLTFGGKHGVGTTVQNTDWSSFGSIQSLAFIENPATSALDLLVADNTGGKISVYPGDFTNGPPRAPSTSTVVWTASQGGPAAPNGLSVDLAGDLYVVNTSAGKPQLWVFPAAGTGGCAPLASYGALCAPVLVDNAFSAGQVLVETTIVPPVPSGGAANTGDLLLLTSNPATVLDYPFPAVSNVHRSTLLSLPAGTMPAGLAFWPLDNSLLITNQAADTILRYSCCSALVAMTPFASNLGGSGKLMYKIKTGFQNGAALAFAVQAGSVADILEFGEGATVSGPGALLATISQNINHPEGIAVTNAAAAAANTCTSAKDGCNPTGLLTHNVPATTAPALVENICVVPQDPRVTVVNNVWSCSGVPLVVNSVCPGFDNTGNNMFIPGYFCGQSGDSASSSPQGFTLIKTLINDSQFNNVLVDNEATINVEPTCLPGAGNDPTLAAVLWGPLAGQGVFVADGKTNEMLDRTDGCGSVHAGSSGGSLWGLGLVLNPAAIVPEVAGVPPSPGGPLGTLGDNKYQDLETTIETTLVSNITPAVAAQLAGPAGCVNLSQSFFDFAQLEGPNPPQQQTPQQTQDYKIAADLLSNAGPSTCDSIVEANLAAFTQSTNPAPPMQPVLDTAAIPRAGFAAGYFLINSRILGNAPNAQAPAWPPNPAPSAPPSGFSTLPPPPDTQTPCVPAGLYPPPGGCPLLNPQPSVVAGYPEPVAFTLYGSNNGTSGCNLTSADGTFNNSQVNANPPIYPFAGTTTGTVPAGTPAGNYTYTMTCAYPDSANTVSSTVQAVVNVLAPPVLTATPASVTLGSANAVSLSWALKGSTACTLTGTQLPVNPNTSTSAMDTPAVTGTITYTLACTTPSMTSTSASVSVTGGTPTLSLSPTSTVGGGSTLVSWVLNGATGCTLSDNGAGTPTQFPGPLAASGSGTYTSVEADAGTGGVTFSLACTSITPVTAFLTVGE